MFVNWSLQCTMRTRNRERESEEGSTVKHRTQKAAKRTDSANMPCLLFINDGTDIMKGKRGEGSGLLAWANNTQLIGFQPET